MTAPSSPFVTVSAVGYMFQVALKGGTTFTATTTPNSNLVAQAITWVSSQVEMQFAMAGYIIPLAELAGETWPDSQTTYLSLITTLGVTAMAGGYAQKPLPAISPSIKGSTGNVFQDLYLAELEKIYSQQFKQTRLNFRAKYRIGTPAQITLTDPSGPTTDFMEGRFDPMRWLPLDDMANRVLTIQDALYDMAINWDYMYGLFGVSRGLGQTLYEPWPLTQP